MGKRIMIYLDLTFHLTLLVAIGIVAGFIENRCAGHTHLLLLLQGVLFGGAAVLSMLRPVELELGLVLDGRSLMVSLCAMFFGPWAAAAAAAPTIACRMWLGGVGMVTDSLVILSSAGIGVLAHFRFKPEAQPPSARDLYLFGLAVHLAMLALMLTVPGDVGPTVVMRIGLPVMLLYPLATILAGKILSAQLKADRAKEALQESEKQYGRLLNSVNDAVFVHPLINGEPGKFTEVNEVACARLGYSREELLSLSPVDIDAGGLDEARSRALETLAKSGQAVFEMVHVGKSGDKAPVEICSRLFESKGKRYVLSIARDISARPPAEAALRASKVFFNTLLDAIPIPVFYKDRDGRYLGCNRTFEIFFGSIREQFIGKSVFDIHPPELARSYQAKDTELFESGGVQQYESKVKNALGVLRDVIFNKAVFTDSHGAISGLIGIILDITERKETEQRLQESEKRLSLTLEATQIGIWDWDVKNDRWYASPIYYTMLGYEPRTGLGDRSEWLERVHPEDRAHVAEKIQDVLTRDFKGYRYEARMRHADGSYRWQQVMGFGIERDRDGKVTRMLGTRMDISERKRAEQERLAHLRFFECMDQVNRAIQGANELEQMMGNVLNTMLSIFDCDRACLFYPCDPDAPTFRVPMEITKPEYLGAKVLNVDLPMSPDMAQNVREVLASDDPVIYIAGTEKPINKVTAEQFGVQSQMLVALYPKLGEPWVLGMHQCSYPRNWTTEEKRLFQEIGRRLSDALTSLLILRNLKESEEKHRTLIQKIQAAVVVHKPDTQILACNPTAEALLGLTEDQLLGKSALDPAWHFFREDGTVMPFEEYPVNQVLAKRQALRNFILGVHRPNKDKENDDDVWVLVNADPVIGKGGHVAQVIVTFIDITERKRVEGALEESEAKMRSILDNVGIGVALISPEMEILELNQRMREWFPAIDPGQHPICYRAFNDPPRELMCDYCPTCKTLQDGLVHEATTQTPQAGGVRNYRIVSSPILNASGEVTAAIEMVEDITEQLSLESQLQQAQKLESVGRLAGGVAHDFNNMLGVILGHAELAMGQMDPAQPHYAALQEIRTAAERSADLTRQLLAFARKQTVAPRVLDLNETVEGMLRMLRRLIGEDIDLVWLPGKNPWQVKVDASQIDQLLANLCVNARDAIAGVGKVTIEMENGERCL
jgi:PAS domain S-box-containing protein